MPALTTMVIDPVLQKSCAKTLTKNILCSLYVNLRLQFCCFKSVKQGIKLSVVETSKSN